MNKQTPAERFQVALKALENIEHLSQRTQNKRWNAFFAAEDALKAWMGDTVTR